uniref:Epidermal patterning factor-like protein n=1 Tax=Haemonchus contortus TaxID=6289 RepID=A0A7I5E779_HAECO
MCENHDYADDPSTTASKPRLVARTLVRCHVCPPLIVSWCACPPTVCKVTGKG